MKKIIKQAILGKTCLDMIAVVASLVPLPWNPEARGLKIILIRSQE